MVDSAASDGVKRPGTREMIALLAGLMALNAFAIDVMIPALPDIGQAFAVEQENHRQLVVLAYMLGFGSTQIVWGPLADRFGRKRVLVAGVSLYTLFALLCGFAGSFELLIAARALQGASAAVTRVLIVAVVRDLYQGEAMARIMSLVFMVFMVVPVLAPLIGQAILLVAPWRWIFLVLAAYGLTMLAWALLRLPETLRPEYRRTLNWRDILSAGAMVVSEPQSRGYTLALTASFGVLIAYIASVQQIVFDAFGAPSAIGPVFAAIAAPMALASWTNSRIVSRFGLRRVGHSAALALSLIPLAHALVSQAFTESLWLFVGLQALTMICFAFTASNLGTLAMEHMAPIAGTASSVQGTVGTVGAVLIGFAIGQSFDGTIYPFLWGTAACGAAGFALVVLTEPKRLFAPIRIDSGDELPTGLPEELR
ncbi:MAG TPA: multidrug effflux MFS transporter [Sphingomicrobium sp.]|nr:multidrug effflux MFS transporter [Sphingomicrobium sp.]